ncbi:super-infection exclusion protein B [Flavobacterium sp. XS2P14]|uniref:super-infection exclusion protein B n=1 Tax=Flavobacterium sp. XS2P14 TaxID=3401735 RepID=UPI003AAB290F
MDFFKSFFDFTKLPTKIFLVFSIVTGVFIFSDSEILKKLHLDKFDEYGGYIGLAFLLSTVLVIVNLIIWIFNKLHFEYKLKKLKAEYKQILTELDPKEKAVLREFAIQSQNSVTMPYDDTVVSGLIDKGILRFNKQLGNSFIANGTKVSISMPTYISKIIKLEHLDLKEKLTEEEEYLILEKRPEWVNNSRRY